MTTAGPELSVVAPVHNEERNVRPLSEGIRDALEPLGRPFEVLLVNDGSTDATGPLLDELAAGDPRLHPIHLEGNFGEAAALCAGFEMARGEIILTLDGDLQNDPAELPRLLALLEDGAYRAVSGWRRKRQEDLTTRVLPSLVANWLISRVTGVPSKDNGCGLKAYRAEVVKGIYLPHGLHRFMPAVFGVRAHEFAQTEVTDRPRQSGRSHYGLSRFFAVLRDLAVIPYLLPGPRDRQRLEAAALRRLASARVSTACGLIVVVLAPIVHPRPLLGQIIPTWIVAAAGILFLARGLHAHLVTQGLRHWLAAQERKTFRIQGSGAASSAGRPALRAAERAEA